MSNIASTTSTVARVNGGRRAEPQSRVHFHGTAPPAWQFPLQSLSSRPWGGSGEEGVTQANFGTASLAVLHTQSTAGDMWIPWGLLSPPACEWLLAFSLHLAFPHFGMPFVATKRFPGKSQGKIVHLY